MSIFLSEEQRKIIEMLDGPILVKAGPGSGKTRVVIEKIKHILFSRPGNKILAITFSNMAANEMRDRLESDIEINDSLTNDVTISTIHSFCLDLFTTYSYLINMNSDVTILDSDSERLKIIKSIIVNDSFRLEINEDYVDKLAGVALKEISSCKRDFKNEDEIEDPRIKYIYKMYNSELFNQNYIDFDDILLLAYRIISENPGVCNIYSNIYKFIFVDEAQDLNYSQYLIINTLFGDKKSNICFVGDANQSIYGFNGSSSKYMTRYFVDYYNPTVFELTKNFRSAKSIVEFANNFKHTKSTLDCFYDGILKAYAFEDENSESLFIVKCIKRLIENGYKDIDHTLSYSDFAIIGRNRYSLDNVTEFLVKENIPIFLKKNNSGIALDSLIMQLFDLCVRLIINNKDKLHANELFSLLGLNNQDLNSWQNAMIISGYGYILDVVSKMFEHGVNIGYYFEELKTQINSNDLIEPNDKFVVTQDIDEYIKHWNKFCSFTISSNRSLQSFRNAVSLGKTAETSVQNGVNIISAHMSKGLQFDVVFIVGLTEGSFPDYRAINSGEDNLEQEKNNMYVAVTRAKRICLLTYPLNRTNKYGSFKQRKSQFLEGLSIQQK